MSQPLNDEILTLLKCLICKITSCEENTENFNNTLKHFIGEIKKSPSMYFSNKKDIDTTVSSMAEKFCFHGFFKQGEALNKAYKEYLRPDLRKSEVINRLNITKLLLELSEKPVAKFFENPELCESIEEEPEEEINWGEFLKEDIPVWCPNYSEQSEGSDSESVSESECEKTLQKIDVCIPTRIEVSSRDIRMDFQANREELLVTIQNNWYNSEEFRMAPKSDWREANIAILWDHFRQRGIKFLVNQKYSNVLSEYCAIREVIWQLFCVHNSAVFELVFNNIKPKGNVTISSVKTNTFERFMCEFVEYIELTDFFREFFKSVKLSNENVPVTYRSYAQGLQEIISPVYKKICDIENDVRKQETTYTLLNLADDLKTLFEPIKLLKKIHKEIILDCNKNTFLICSTNVITKLHESLPYCLNKFEQDVRVTLFLHSIFHYLYLVDCWLQRDDLYDYTEEFLIVREENCELWEINYVLHSDVEMMYSGNSFLKIFWEKVLKIGRNVHFLMLLEKYDVIGYNEESIRDEFYRKTIEELCKFYNVNPEEYIRDDKKIEYEEVSSKFSAENYNFPSSGENINNIENLNVDTADGFLMVAFQDFFLKSSQKDLEIITEETLFEKISKITKNLFPKSYFFERIFGNILEKRFTISGLMVKNILIEKYLLEKHFQFFRHVYLFFDDIIFPFYRRLFEKTTSSRIWSNNISLTSHFQDVIMDLYPEFFEKCSVLLKENVSQSIDFLKACDYITIKYDIIWPVNIIITEHQIVMYKNVFEFILKLKWALYIVNHLRYKDLEGKKITNKAVKTRNMRLKVLRFSILNVLNTVQHFLFGFAFKKSLIQFEIDFEKASDLNTLIESHSMFISTIYGVVESIKIEKNKFNELLICVKQLKNMWDYPQNIKEEHINDCFVKYDIFYKNISPIVFPVYLFDY